MDSKLETLKVEETYWKDKANRVEDDPYRETLYKTIDDVAILKADELRLRANVRPESEIAQNIVREEAERKDLTRFERFKRWAKRNLGGISVFAISIAGIMGVRTVIRRGANATSKFAKFLGKVAEKGPILGALLNLATGILKLGAKAVSFLAENLWIPAVLITYALYDRVKNRRKTNTEGYKNK